MRTSEVFCKTALSPSKLADYALNCYVGCQHGCCYCYAKFMARFTDHDEPWGEFVDAKVNIVEVLLRQLPRKPLGRVTISSVCDGWQPLEERYRLTRDCARLLMAYGHEVSILTKNALVKRDLDLFAGRRNVELGATVTTADEDLRQIVEPMASPTAERFRVLKAAAEQGIAVWLFVGPLLPFLFDSRENIDRLMGEASRLPLARVYVDKLNLRPKVWRSLKAMLIRHFPEMASRYEEICFDPRRQKRYVRELRERVCCAAEAKGVRPITVLF